MKYGLGLWCLMPLSTIFQLYRAVSFIGGGNQIKPPICRKSLTNLTHTVVSHEICITYQRIHVITYIILNNIHVLHQSLYLCFFLSTLFTEEGRVRHVLNSKSIKNNEIKHIDLSTHFESLMSVH